MRIGLNLSTVSGRIAGVGNYAFNLARKLPVVAPEEEWFFFGSDPALSDSLAAGPARVVAGRKPGLARILWEQTELPLAARRERLDLLHGADFSRPVVYRGRMVNTIHGISAFSDEDFYPPASRGYKRALTRYALRRSSAIITVSEFTRQQILDRFGIDGKKVFAIHHGVEPARSVCKPREDPPFLLFVGTLENRKNLVRLVEAFRILKRGHHIPHRLVLAGQPGHGFETLRKAIEDSKVSNAIDMPGYVKQDDLARLYRTATLLTFPAFWEDFGFPVVEAMTYGLPVVCARAVALPEVAGDAAEYFDPLDTEDMMTVIERVLCSRDRWLELHKKGLERGARYTWEECVRKHIAVYRQTLAA